MAQIVKRMASHYGFEIRRNSSSIGNMPQFLHLLRKNGLIATTILDVGANHGDWSQLARSVFPEAKFTLIEPQGEMQPSLEGFCAEAPGSRYSIAGAGPEASETVLTIWPDLAGSTMLPPPKSCATYEKRRVPIITIDSLYQDGDELPQLAKLDIQGYELQALAGATKLFGRTECFILEVSLFEAIEGIPQVAEVVEFMNKRGYKVYDIAGHLRRPLDNALAQVDLAFVRKAGKLNSDQRFARAPQGCSTSDVRAPQLDDPRRK